MEISPGGLCDLEDAMYGTDQAGILGTSLPRQQLI